MVIHKHTFVLLNFTNLYQHLIIRSKLFSTIEAVDLRYE